MRIKENERPASISTATSTSLSGRSSPRATEPNTAKWRTPRRRSSGSSAASRCRTASRVFVAMVSRDSQVLAEDRLGQAGLPGGGSPDSP